MTISLRRGIDTATPAGGGSTRSPLLSIADGTPELVRFLTDLRPTEHNGELVGGIIPFFQHSNVPTLPQPDGWTGDNYPPRMTAICRKDPVLIEEFGGACYICDEIMPRHSDIKKPTERFFGLAVKREEVFEGTQRIGFRDATREVTRKTGDTEETSTQKALVVAAFSTFNFWNHLEAIYDLNGTVLDRDILIRRSGEKLKTVYSFAAHDAISIEHPVTHESARFDLRDPAFMARYLPEATTLGAAAACEKFLIDSIQDRWSDEFYGKFFDPNLRGISSASTSSAPAAPAPTPAPAPQASEAAMASLAERLGVTQTSAPVTTPAPATGMVDFG